MTTQLADQDLVAPRRPPSLRTVVVPVYNEVESVEALLAEIEAGCALTGRAWEVIFIDDGSTDGTANLIEAALS